MHHADSALRLRHRLFWVGTFVGACTVLWLPFGFGLTGVLEEWGVLSLFTTHHPIFFAGPDTPLAAHRLRPLTVLPHALLYSLTPDSFDSWNLLLIAALLAKGMAAALLGERVTGSRRWGLVFGLLVLLQPADTMQLSFRALHINLSLALVLLGSALLVRLEPTDSRPRLLLVGTLASALLLVSVLMYEAAAPLVLTPLLFWFARDGLRGLVTRIRTLTVPVLLWFAGMVLFAVYAIASSRVGETTYQQSLATGGSLASMLSVALPKLFDPGLMRSLLGGWVDAWRMAHRELAGYGMLALAVAVLGLCLVLAAGPEARRRRNESTPQRAGLAIRLVLAGVVLVLLGFAPYTISAAHVAITQRTYLFTAPGAALVVLALLLALARVSRLLCVPAVALLLGLGIAAQWVQFRHYAEISQQQRQILKEIVENFDGKLDGQTLVVKDLSGRLGHLWMLRDHLGMALTYLYGKQIDAVEICLTPTLAWQQLDDLGRPGRCVQQNEGWTFSKAAPVSGPGRPMRATEPDKVIAASRVRVIEIQPDGHVESSPALAGYRDQLSHGNDVVDRRYRSILAQRHTDFDAGLFKPADPQRFT